MEKENAMAVNFDVISYTPELYATLVAYCDRIQYNSVHYLFFLGKKLKYTLKTLQKTNLNITCVLDIRPTEKSSKRHH